MPPGNKSTPLPQERGAPEGLLEGRKGGERGAPPQKKLKKQSLFPFTGDFAGSSFNSQAFFSSNRGKQDRRQKYVSRLCTKHDFVGVQETHSTKGRVQAWDGIRGVTGFWSHGDRRTRGVALLVQDSFLAKFDSHSWNLSKE